MLMMDGEEVSQRLSMSECIGVMEEAFLQLARREARMPLRSVVPLPDGHLFGLMPAYLSRTEVVGAKLITVFPDNRERGLPSHQGVVMLFDAATGEPLGAFDAEAITAVRTAAVSALATRLLASPSASVLALLGTGRQARTHLAAMQAVRAIQAVRVWGPHQARAMAFKAEMEESAGIPVTVCESPKEAAWSADIVCTVTASTRPILERAFVKDGAHINAVGACRAGDRELSSSLMAAARLFVDSRDSALQEAGDYLIPLSEGAVGPAHLVGELGDLLTDRLPGRTDPEEITLFKSLGLAVEDLACAQFLYQRKVAERDDRRPGL